MIQIRFQRKMRTKQINHFELIKISSIYRYQVSYRFSKTRTLTTISKDGVEVNYVNTRHACCTICFQFVFVFLMHKCPSVCPQVSYDRRKCLYLQNKVLIKFWSFTTSELLDEPESEKYRFVIEVVIEQSFVKEL